VQREHFRVCKEEKYKIISVNVRSSGGAAAHPQLYVAPPLFVNCNASLPNNCNINHAHDDSKNVLHCHSEEIKT
jgi:hypothetical protein